MKNSFWALFTVLLFSFFILYTLAQSYLSISVSENLPVKKESALNSGNLAIFQLDTLRLSAITRDNPKYFKEISEMKWVINQQTLQFGYPPVQVIPNKNKLDTILFQKDANAKWDTLICNISKAQIYNFQYNECCGAFNVIDATNNRFIKGSLSLKLTRKAKHKQYIGTLGEAGMSIQNTIPDTLKPACRSAMSPNIYWVSLKEIVECKNTQKCDISMCFYNGKEEVYDFEYSTKKEITEFLYLPLSNEPLSISYNPFNQELIIL